MAPPVTMITKIGSGHGSFPPTAIIAGSSNTTVNSLPVARVGDALAPHGSPSPSPSHGRVIAAGSTKTRVNSLDSARIGDPISCGGLIASGSNNTTFG